MRENRQPEFQTAAPSETELQPEFHEYGLTIPDHFIFEGQRLSLIDLITYVNVSIDDRPDRRGNLSVYSEKQHKYKTYLEKQPNAMGMPDYERSQHMKRAYFDQCRKDLQVQNKKVTLQDIAQIYVATFLDPAARESNPYHLACGFSNSKKLVGENWRLVVEEFLSVNAGSDRLYDFLLSSNITMSAINGMKIGDHNQLRNYIFERDISYDKLVALRVNSEEIIPAHVKIIEDIFYPGAVPDLREFAGNNIPIIMSRHAIGEGRHAQRIKEDELPNYGGIYETMGISPQVQAQIKNVLGDKYLKDWLICEFVNDIKELTGV